MHCQRPSQAPSGRCAAHWPRGGPLVCGTEAEQPQAARGEVAGTQCRTRGVGQVVGRLGAEAPQVGMRRGLVMEKLGQAGPSFPGFGDGVRGIGSRRQGELLRRSFERSEKRPRRR